MEHLLDRVQECSKMCRSCMTQSPRDKRVLLFRPHLHNGLGNRMSGVRGAYQMALQTHRSFWLDWPAHQSESSFFHMQRTATSISCYIPWDRSSCAPTFFDTRPNMNVFTRNIAMSNETIIVFQEIYHDLGFDMKANAAYLSLLRPTLPFLQHMKAHFAKLGLDATNGWIGLQIRLNENQKLAAKDQLKIWKSIKCAQSIAKQLRCDIFATTNSPTVLRVLRSTEIKYERNESFMRHSSPHTGYLPALLEFATLATSQFIIGTAGSTFAREAANFGGISSVMMDHGYRIRSHIKSDQVCAYSSPYGQNVFV